MTRTSTSTGAWARRGIVALTMASLAIGLGAGTALAGARHRVADTASETCQELVDGTFAVDSRDEDNASRSCAAACGVLVDGDRAAAKHTDEELLEDALATCADACSFIIDEVQSRRAQSRGDDPFSLALEACWQALESGSDTLPTIDSGGRSWR